MGRVRVIDTFDLAKRDRETFHDSPVQKQVQLKARWPKTLLDIGRGYGILYRSDKWKTIDNYKHLRESDWRILVNPSFRMTWSDGSVDIRKTDLVETFDVAGSMPKHVAYIGKCFGVQGILNDGQIVHIEIPGAHWGAVRVPGEKQAVLIAYSNAIDVVVVGEDLGIEKDGIVG
jgi:hypothetical protein